MEPKIMNNKVWVIGRLFAAAILAYAIEDHPYGYYTLLRWIVCFAAGYSAYAISLICDFEPLGYTDWKATFWMWVFYPMAILFNPIIPVHLPKDTWAPIDMIGAILMAASILFLRFPPEPKEDANNSHGEARA
jgi:hypothetical protein